MLLVYVDNIMIISHLGDAVARQIGKFYNTKEGSQGTPTWYLEIKTEKIQNKGGREIWETLSRSYITTDIETVEGFLLEDVKCEVLKYNARNPFPPNYRPYIDVTEELILSCCLGTCSL